mmetsp:Transcript_23007/g.71370  ORF Transcript_23007/g.71370 Transcript_23007/m.71370 type:complete len:210 (+) Transcript_23007:1119-1748(+)
MGTWRAPKKHRTETRRRKCYISHDCSCVKALESPGLFNAPLRLALHPASSMRRSSDASCRRSSDTLVRRRGSRCSIPYSTRRHPSSAAALGITPDGSCDLARGPAMLAFARDCTALAPRPHIAAPGSRGSPDREPSGPVNDESPSVRCDPSSTTLCGSANDGIGGATSWALSAGARGRCECTVDCGETVCDPPMSADEAGWNGLRLGET